LNSFIADICKEAGKKLSDIDAVAVSKGPGSYTGLRIGVSAAKGFCFSLNIPLISVDTLQAMAKSQNHQNVFFCPMIDARRMEVYTALYDAEGNKIEDISAKIIDENSFEKELKANKIIFFGDGAEKCRVVLESNPNAIFIENVHPSAKYVNELALEKYNNKEFEDLAYFEPFYLKDFIATTPKKLL
jgi:tRNA threonylcarbamoyladenosine biosynthesis protein TsaB